MVNAKTNVTVFRDLNIKDNSQKLLLFFLNFYIRGVLSGYGNAQVVDLLVCDPQPTVVHRV